jgi:glucokinase
MPGLVGDVGGTNARFALAELREGRPVVSRAETFPNRDFASPQAVIEAYLERIGAERRPERVVIAVAGPVTRGAAHLTNLDWEFSEAALKAKAGFRDARLVNDFAAMALGAARLGPDGLRPLGPRIAGDPQATIAVLGPGTGFGQGGVVRQDGREMVLTTEGGHVAFAPTDELEVEIWKRLAAQFGRVSVERILSGPGLYDLYLAMAAIRGEASACADEREVHAAADAGDALADAAVDRFVLILGSTAGDIALGLGARGGVYVTGGVAQKLADRIAGDGFRKRFEAKGRFHGYMRAIPTWLITDPYTALIGSAAVLAQMEAA